MKRTNWIDISYWHYYPDGLSGGILYGLFMPPGIKVNRNIQGRCFCVKAPSLFYLPTYFDKIRRKLLLYAEFRENIHGIILKKYVQKQELFICHTAYSKHRDL